MVGWEIVRGLEVVVGHGGGRIHLRLRPGASGIERPNAWAQVRRSRLERRRRLYLTMVVVVAMAVYGGF